MSSPILGQGDFQTLLEKAEEVFSEDQAKELERKLTEQKGLDFDRFPHATGAAEKYGALRSIDGSDAL